MKKQNLIRGLLMTALLTGIFTAAGTDNKAYAEGGYLGSGNRTETTIVIPSPPPEERGGYIVSSGRSAGDVSENRMTASADESEDFESIIELIFVILF